MMVLSSSLPPYDGPFSLPPYDKWSAHLQSAVHQGSRTVTILYSALHQGSRTARRQPCSILYYIKARKTATIQYSVVHQV